MCLQEDMNLNEERKAPLRGKDLSTKREMVVQYISATAKSVSAPRHWGGRSQKERETDRGESGDESHDETLRNNELNLICFLPLLLKPQIFDCRLLQLFYLLFILIYLFCIFPVSLFFFFFLGAYQAAFVVLHFPKASYCRGSSFHQNLVRITVSAR